MTRLGRFLRNLVERILGRYYEGPDPPRRLAEEARLFRVFHPLADADQWEAFLIERVHAAYRDGFVRGFEWCERSWEGPAIDPDRLAELQAHDWSLAEHDARFAQAMSEVASPSTAREIAERSETAALAVRQGRTVFYVPHGRRED